MRSLKETGVYTVVDRPQGKKVVKLKWVCKKKLTRTGLSTSTRPDAWQKGSFNGKEWTTETLSLQLFDTNQSR